MMSIKELEKIFNDNLLYVKKWAISYRKELYMYGDKLCIKDSNPVKVINITFENIKVLMKFEKCINEEESRVEVRRSIYYYIMQQLVKFETTLEHNI